MDKIVKILASVLFSVCISSIGFWLYRVFETPFCRHHTGVVLVVVGCAGALIFGHEHTNSLGKKLERWFEVLLLIGLVLELHETVVEDSQILALQRQLQPRAITQKQIRDFIFLTENLPKIPIRVAVPEGNAEAGSYAWQIRDMLSKANFPTPDSDKNYFVGVDFMPDAITLPIYYDTNGSFWAEGQFLYNGTNDPTVFHYSTIENTNGLSRFTILPTDTNSIDGALINYLVQIGVVLKIQREPSFVGPNQVAIYINPKVQ